MNKHRLENQHIQLNTLQLRQYMCRAHKDNHNTYPQTTQ